MLMGYGLLQSYDLENVRANEESSLWDAHFDGNALKLLFIGDNDANRVNFHSFPDGKVSVVKFPCLFRNNGLDDGAVEHFVEYVGFLAGGQEAVIATCCEDSEGLGKSGVRLLIVDSLLKSVVDKGRVCSADWDSTAVTHCNDDIFFLCFVSKVLIQVDVRTCKEVNEFDLNEKVYRPVFGYTRSPYFACWADAIYFFWPDAMNGGGFNSGVRFCPKTDSSSAISIGCVEDLALNEKPRSYRLTTSAGGDLYLVCNNSAFLYLLRLTSSSSVAASTGCDACSARGQLAFSWSLVAKMAHLDTEQEYGRICAFYARPSAHPEIPSKRDFAVVEILAGEQKSGRLSACAHLFNDVRPPTLQDLAILALLTAAQGSQDEVEVKAVINLLRGTTKLAFDLAEKWDVSWANRLLKFAEKSRVAWLTSACGAALMESLAEATDERGLSRVLRLSARFRLHSLMDACEKRRLELHNKRQKTVK